MLNNKQNSITIVIADDDADDRMLIEDAFRESRLGNKLAFAEDGEDLLEYLRGTGRHSGRDAKDLPGLILLDLNMPRMDGRTALEHLKKDPLLRRIPVIAVTAFAMKGDEERIRQGGCEAYISKPISVPRFIETIKSYLGDA